MATLSGVITIIRGKLDDKVPTLAGAYGWGNDELVSCVNETVNELCTKAAMIVDATTAAICTHALLANGYALSLSDRITGILRAELASTGAVLGVVINVDEMDMIQPGWKSTASSVPSKIIKDGLGNNVARVWPPTLLADTINLTVSRLPLTDMTWAADQATEIPIPSIYHDKLFDGILARAYRMHDVDAENLRLAVDYEKKWTDRVEEIRKAHLHKEMVPHTAAPAASWM